MSKKICIIIVTVLLVLIASYSSIVIANNIVAKNLEQDLLDCAIPVEIHIIDSVSIAKKTSGNGNGMQWHGALLVKSELTKDELTAYYENLITDDNLCISVSAQDSPLVFEQYKYHFKYYDPIDFYYCVMLSKNSISGLETSFFEKILNFDVRGH